MSSLAEPSRDPEFVRDILAELPGVDLTDPRLQEFILRCSLCPEQPIQSQPQTPQHPTTALKQAYARFKSAASTEQTIEAREAVLRAKRRVAVLIAERELATAIAKGDPDGIAVTQAALSEAQSAQDEAAELQAAIDLSLSSVVCSHDEAAQFDGIIIFGDSWSNTEWMGGCVKPWSEQIAASLGISANKVQNMGESGSMSSDLSTQLTKCNPAEITSNSLVIIHTGGNDTWKLIRDFERIRDTVQGIMGFGPSPYHQTFAAIAQFVNLILEKSSANPTFLIASPPLSTKLPVIRDKLLPAIRAFMPEMQGELTAGLDTYGASTAFVDLNTTIMDSVPSESRIFFFNEAAAVGEIQNERGAPWDSLMIADGLHPTTEGHSLLAAKALEHCPDLQAALVY